MSAIQQLLRRWGFVKLGSYGLMLTPDGRVMSTRPGVLDDGVGNRIVGWEDGDLAMAELKPWEPARSSQPARLAAPAKPAPALIAAATPAPVAIAPVRAPAPAPAPVRVVAIPPVAPAAAEPASLASPTYPQVISEASLMAQAQAHTSADVMPQPVAGEPVVDEDDWEWTIALARARAEEVDPPARPANSAAKARLGTSPLVSRSSVASATRPASAKATAIMATVASPEGVRTRPMGAVTATIGAPPVMKDPAASGEWPKTELIGEIDYEQAPTRTAVPVQGAQAQTSRHAASAPVARPRPATTPPAVHSAATRARPATKPPSLPRAPAKPATVIPVPSLPTMSGSAQTRPFEPVVRTPTSQLPTVAARRLGKGTGPLDDTPAPGELAAGTDVQAQAQMSDDTLPNLSIGDRTTPGIAMPLAARAVQLPSVKRRAAQRS